MKCCTSINVIEVQHFTKNKTVSYNISLGKALSYIDLYDLLGLTLIVYT